MKKLILSGGWSYGNLGDEAILMASVKLLHQLFPDYTIVTLLYKKNETVKYLEALDYVQIEQSLHSLMYGVQEKKMKFGECFLNELIYPIKRRFNNQLAPIREKNELKNFLKSPDAYYKNYVTAKEYFSTFCKDADLYVMSGGGYINNWNEMIISKLLEVHTAKEHGLRTYMIGQTVGPFNKYAKEVYRLALENIDGCFFRDSESIKDTKALGYDCLTEVIPDMALSEETLYAKDNYIVFVPFLTDLNQHMDDIIENIRAIVADSGCKIVITVSQQWPWCMQVATSFYIAMINKGIEVKYVIPEDYKELEQILSSAQFVFSQNLHGLILAYRGHTPVVSLNDRRKFVSFMTTIGHKENLIAPQHITSTNLYDCYKRRGEYEFSNCKKFQQQITEAIKQTLY
mgnify:FL=1